MTLNLVLVIILLGGWLFSKLFAKMNLPKVIGMVVFGIILNNFSNKSIPESLWILEPTLKSLALIVILLRAGLGLSKTALQKAGRVAVLMSFLPCFFEAVSLTFLFHLLFRFSWSVSGLTACMLSAVSPAVIVPSMLDLLEKGYGKKNEVPTIVLAGASVDDVIAITFFSLFLGFELQDKINIMKTILSIPLTIFGGIVSGLIMGYILVKYFKKRQNQIRATEKTLLVLTIAMLLVQIGEWTHIAALLGIMTTGLILIEYAELAAHELSVKLQKVWIFAEIFLFVLIGLSVDIPTAIQAGLKSIVTIIIGLLFRFFGVFLSTIRSNLSWKERIFCMIAYIPKATVQAALGSIALQNNIPEGEKILAIAVVSIIFTAPIGLIGITYLGNKLLDLKMDVIAEDET